MKTCLLSSLLASTVLLLVSCDRGPSVTAGSSPASPAPTVGIPNADENAALEKEIAELKAQEAELRVQMQQDQLAVEKAELERQRGELTKEKERVEAAAAGKPVDGAVVDPSPVDRRAGPVDSSVAVAPPAAGNRDYQMFYEGLAPYGEWMETPEYGYFWLPAARRAAGWRPYTMGRWADSDQGWTWISDEPFGWAVYHYGRWVMLQSHGWIWVPGDTWAPAWVSWRNNAEYVGWSPLPPETVDAGDLDYGPGVDDDYGISPDSYTFMPVRYFDEPVYPYCRPRSESAGFFGLTLGVTRIVIRSGNVHCGGPEPRWVNSCLSRPMHRYRLDRDDDWEDRRDYRPRFEQDRLSCYTPRVSNSWNEGLRPSRLAGRLDNIKVVRRGETLRGDLARRYADEQRERRERASVSLRNDTIRQQVEKQGKLEKIRSQRDQLTQRQQGSDTGEGKDRGRDPKVEPDKRNPADAIRGFEERNRKLEAGRKELKERQEEVARLRQQREAVRPATSDLGSGRDRTDSTPEIVREDSQKPDKTKESGDRERVAEQAQHGQRESQAAKEREDSARRELVKENEARQRIAEQAERGQSGKEPVKEREDSARLEQAKENEAPQRLAGQAQLGQREKEATTEREVRDRRGQEKENEARQRMAEQAQRGQRESQAAQEREENVRRDQAKQIEARQRIAEQAERGQRESQVVKEREESVRREQVKENEARQRLAGQAQRGQRESQAAKEREDSGRREQAKQNEARQRQAEAAQRGQRKSQAVKEREDSTRREQAKQNEARQRIAEQAQRGQRESQAANERDDSVRREQAKQNESRQRQAEAAQRGQRDSKAAKEREDSARREQSWQNESRQKQAEQERGNREREDNARREQAKQNEAQQRGSEERKKREDDEGKAKRGR